jgi:hypothetical protein
MSGYVGKGSRWDILSRKWACCPRGVIRLSRAQEETGEEREDARSRQQVRPGRLDVAAAHGEEILSVSIMMGVGA